MSVRPSTRRLPALRTLCLDAALIVLLAGCVEKDNADVTGDSQTGDRSNPTLDVRGGVANSDTGNGRRVQADGDGGNGGTAQVVSSGGNVTIQRAAIAATAQVQTFAGNGIDVADGESVTLASSLELDFFRVQAGGQVRLIEDTFLVVNGDVLIAGRIDGRGDKHFIDGRSLTIEAAGIVNITGSIDCGGFRKDLEDLPVVERRDAPGGDGGQVIITSEAGAPSPSLFISGVVHADGGDSFSTVDSTALPGSGGRIAMTSLGDLALSGRMTARGGACYFVVDGEEALGGTIEITATGDIEIGEVRELNAGGGQGSGSTGGNGGTIALEATVGALAVTDFDIESRGGDTTFSTAGEAGAGGTVTFTGATVSLTNVSVNVTGGHATFEDSGEGGAGGTVGITADSGITVTPDVVLLAEGGDTLLELTDGGAGGALEIENLGATTDLDFQGAASVEAGVSAVRSFGPSGTICAENLDVDSDSYFKIIGTNNVTISDDCPD